MRGAGETRLADEERARRVWEELRDSCGWLEMEPWEELTNMDRLVVRSATAAIDGSEGATA